MVRFARMGLVALALLPLRASADDSSAALQAGGLVLQKTDKIALVAEDLYLSASAVRIFYRFRNLTGSDYETTIAFPMPDLTGDPNMIVSIPDPGNDNFLKFQSTVDGRPVASQVEQRAFLTPSGKPEVEITDRLKALGLPLVPTLDATETAMARLTEAQRKSLADAGIVEAQEFNDDKGRRTVHYPLWTLRSKFWRKQVFPAGQEIAVRQEYVPAVGGQSTLSIGSPSMDKEQLERYRTEFCTDEAFVKAAGQLYKRIDADEGKTFQAYEQYLSYIIKSGGNWAGPIGTFRLTVDKEDPKALLSFCGKGVRKTGPTRFEMEIKDYVPDRDLDVLFLRTVTNR